MSSKFNISDRVKNLEESETLAMSKKSNELRSRGIDVINLSLGEPDFATPQPIKDAAKKAIDQNFSYYSPVSGFLDLREKIVSKLKTENNLEFKTDQIVVSTGAKQSLANLMSVLLNPQDEVIIPAPFWVSYKEMVEFTGGKAVIIKAGIEQDFKITPDQLEHAITKKTKAFLLANPSNPTGSVYTPSELKELVSVLKKYPSVVVISDEIYEYIIFDAQYCSIGEFAEIKNQVVIVNGLSKSFAMTGWRLGYIAAPREIALACEKVQGQSTSGASSISQKAAIEAFQMGRNHSAVQEMVHAYKSRRDILRRELSKVPGFILHNPQGAFYLFPEIKKLFGLKYNENVIGNSKDLVMYLLDQANVALTAGMAFGAPECIRFSYAIKEERLIEAANRIKAAVEKLI